MTQENEEIKILREQMHGLDDLKTTIDAIRIYNDRLYTVPRHQQSPQEKLWLLGCSSLFNSENSLETEEGIAAFSELVTTLFKSIPSQG